ncbi:MAG TPA: elongation factor Ts [Dehalococcoidales bacterium]|nr:elongation factor Ts [Dehalococcoidales bacterium]
MKIPTSKIKQVRDLSGAGIMECRNALIEAEGDEDKALDIIKERCIFWVQKKTERSTTQGVIEAYVHTGGRIGALVEVNCETDFVARTDEFKELAHHLAMQVAAMSPQFVAEEEIPQDADVERQTACLVLQPDIRDPDRTIQDIINETIARVGENIKVSRFVRFELGS